MAIPRHPYTPPMPPRTAFFGSPDFACPTLQALIDSPYTPSVVVTQPDRPAGRGRAPQPPPVKALAERHRIPVLQPPKLRDPAAVAQLAEYHPALQIIVAYGQILPTTVLDLPQHGTLNVHASLLPRWRGASPIQAALRAGDTETGVTIMLVDEGEDTGPIVAARRLPIHPTDDAGALSDRLAAAGADLLLETIPRWLHGDLTPTPQHDADATRAPRIRKADGRIDWTRPAPEIDRHVRACTPWPGATTTLHRRPVTVWRATPHPATDAAAAAGAAGPPGRILAAGDTIDIATGGGVLRIHELQRAGKRRLPAADFARGERDLIGAVLGDDDPEATHG